MRSNVFFIKFIMSILLASVFVGCSSKEEVKPKFVEYEEEVKTLKPYTFKYKPIIGSRNSDSRVVVDQGVVLKAWINTYKLDRGTLIPSHDIYVRVKEPDFIPQYATPPRMQNKGLLTDTKETPFMLSDKEIDRSSTKTNEGIKNYVNSVYEKNSPEKEEERVQEGTQFDNEIKDYIKNRSK